VKLLTYRTSAGLRAGGVGRNGKVYDLADASRHAPGGDALPERLLDLLALEDAGLERVRTVLAWADQSGTVEGTPIAQVRLAAPLPRPGKLIAVAANYTEHIVEGRGETYERREQTPWLFMKPGTAVIGDGEPILLPAMSDRVDWEIELAVIIGRRGRYIPESRAYDHVAGYTIVNDVSARRVNVGFERKRRDGDNWFDWLHGKWFDSFAPMGPVMTTRDEIADPHALGFTLAVDGIVRQQDNTRKMIFGVADLVVFASRIMTLEPGDVIATGTASGTGSATGTFLSDGQTVEASLDGIGVLRNPVRSDGAPA
jgi:2-keto-4-pentenoate hydratase/2-oxohepta-3-ene-1,7-dioic acid hydratase in catechol pathway